MPVPFIVWGAVAGVSAIVAATQIGCSGKTKTASPDGDRDEDTIDETPEQISVEEEGVAEQPYEGAPNDAPEHASDLDIEADRMEGDRPLIVRDLRYDHFTNAPCQFPASISITPKGLISEMLVTCPGDVLSSARTARAYFYDYASPRGWENVGMLSSGQPAHHLVLPDGNILITHSSPDGLTVMGPSGNIVQQVLLEELTLRDNEGKPLDFVPSFPGGAAVAGGFACMATSNVLKFNADERLTSFHPGTVICFPYLQNQSIKADDARVFFLPGVNPSGIVADARQGTRPTRIIALASNSYDPENGNGAFLSIIDPAEGMQESVPLGNITAQPIPTLSMTQAGMIAMGMYAPKKGYLFVDINHPDSLRRSELPAITNFTPSVLQYGGLIFISDFGTRNGQVLAVDPNADRISALKTLPGNAGLATISRGYHYQIVTSDDGAKIVRAWVGE